MISWKTQVKAAAAKTKQMKSLPLPRPISSQHINTHIHTRIATAVSMQQHVAQKMGQRQTTRIKEIARNAFCGLWAMKQQPKIQDLLCRLHLELHGKRRIAMSDKSIEFARQISARMPADRQMNAVQWLIWINNRHSILIVAEFVTRLKRQLNVTASILTQDKGFLTMTNLQCLLNWL